MKQVYRFILVCSVTGLVLLTGCGGGGGGSLAGIGGTGRVASGTITGFGSIFVNDGRYDVDSAACEVDDEDRSGTCQANLEIGMVVTVVSDDFDGTAGTATSVIYDDDAEGPVSDLIDDGSTKRFVVLGTNVIADAATTVFDDGFTGFTFDTIDVDDIVEVSGFFDGTGVLNATYVEKKGVLVPGASQVEIKGAVSNAGTGAGIGGSFTVNGITVNIDSTTDLGDIPGGLVTNDMFVEAEGVLTLAGEIDAARVELEDDGIGDNEDDASIEGLISNFVNNSNFRVAGQLVDASSATFEPTSLQLTDGLRVEVEGPVIGGTLIADEVEAEGGEIVINATVSAVDPSNNTVTLTLGTPGNLTVRVDGETGIEDESGGTLTLADIVPTVDFLEVRGFDDGAGTTIATEIRRSADTDNDIILQGPMDDFDPAGGSITVLGIVFAINTSTDYEDANENLLADANAFDALASNGDIVKIKDNDPSGGGTPNGIADEIDLED